MSCRIKLVREGLMIFKFAYDSDVIHGYLIWDSATSTLHYYERILNARLLELGLSDYIGRDGYNYLLQFTVTINVRLGLPQFEYYPSYGVRLPFVDEMNGAIDPLGHSSTNCEILDLMLRFIGRQMLCYFSPNNLGAQVGVHALADYIHRVIYDCGNPLKPDYAITVTEYCAKQFGLMKTPIVPNSLISEAYGSGKGQIRSISTPEMDRSEYCFIF